MKRGCQSPCHECLCQACGPYFTCVANAQKNGQPIFKSGKKYRGSLVPVLGRPPPADDYPIPPSPSPQGSPAAPSADAAPAPEKRGGLPAGVAGAA